MSKKINIFLFSVILIFFLSWIRPKDITKSSENFAVEKYPSNNSEETFLDVQINEAIEAERKSITEELSTYPDIEDGQVEDLMTERGGRPIQSLIVTTWRSGSTFLGQVLNSHPVSAYHYEPLHQFGLAQIRSGRLAYEAVTSLSKLLHCNYTGMEGYMSHNREANINIINTENKRMWRHCLAGGKEKEAIAKSYCWNVEFASQFCKLIPFQSIKTVRLRLNLTETLVADASINLKIVLLVRDPRGTMNSRKSKSWCSGNPDCEDPAKLCKDLEDDFQAFQVLRAKYPSRYKVVRYEDFSLNTDKYSKDVLQFYGLPLHEDVEKYLASHTKEDKGHTGRDSKKTPFLWREHLSKEEVKKIQESCKTALSLWGYNLYLETENLKTFEPVLQLGQFEV